MYHHLPNYLILRLQRVQIAAVSFVLNRYATMYLGWLPVTYNMELNFYKTVFKALNNENWPPYLRLEVLELAGFKLNKQPTPRPSKLARREPPSYANAKSFKYPFSNLACDPLLM